jgi:hypothetical protein
MRDLPAAEIKCAAAAGRVVSGTVPVIKNGLRWRDARPSASAARRSLESFSDQLLELLCLRSVHLHLFLSELRLKGHELLETLRLGHFFDQRESRVGILFRYGHGAVLHVLEASDFEARDDRIGGRRAHSGVRGAAFPFLESFSDQAE